MMETETFRFFDDPRIEDPPRVSPEYRSRLARAEIEDMWSRFQVLCPDSWRAFLRTARDNFRGMVWQMHVTLLASSLPGFEPGREEGPDFFVKAGGLRCAVECTALRLTPDYPGHLPRPGMPMRSSFGWGPAYEDHRVARIGQILRDKRSDRERYIEKGIVKSNEPYVIAVSLGELFQGAEELPDAIRATYALGPLTISIPVNRTTGGPGGEEQVGYPPQFGIRRSPEKSPLDNDFFLGPGREAISGVISSDLFMAAQSGPPGNELVFVHNVFADSPVPLGTFPWGREFGPTIAVIKDWRWG
jgi:hypothetical protein